AAAGIVAVSLILSGALSWVLVRDVELQGAQDQLDRSILVDATLVRHYECQRFLTPLSNAGPAACALADQATYINRLSDLVVPSLGSDRLLLLNRQRFVVFDSGGGQLDQPITVQASKRVAGVAEAQPSLEGQTYLA